MLVGLALALACGAPSDARAQADTETLDFQEYGTSYSATTPGLGLPDEVLEKFYSSNAVRLLGLERASAGAAREQASAGIVREQVYAGVVREE